MSYVCHYSFIQNSLTALKIPFIPPNLYPNPWQLLIWDCLKFLPFPEGHVFGIIEYLAFSNLHLHIA